MENKFGYKYVFIWNWNCSDEFSLVEISEYEGLAEGEI